MRHSRQYYLRRLHRYLGVTIGIQFLLWTAGGLYCRAGISIIP